MRDASRDASRRAFANAREHAHEAASRARALEALARATATTERERACAELARVAVRASRCADVLDDIAKYAREEKRALALETFADVAECASAFGALRERGEATRFARDGVFDDDDRKSEAFARARRALACLTSIDADVSELEESEWRRLVRRTKDGLEEYCDRAENALLDSFAEALRKGDGTTMSATVNALWGVQDGASVIARYVSTRSTFLSNSSAEDSQSVRYALERAITTGQSNARSKAIYCAFFENIRDMLSREFSTNIVVAFGDRANVVLSALVRRVAEQRVSDVIETLLTTELKTVDSLRQRLTFTALTLSELDKTNRLIRKLAKDDKSVQLIMAEDFFVEACATLVEDECACLDSTPDDDALLSMNRCEEGTIDSMCANYREAMDRCGACLNKDTFDLARVRLTQTLLDRVLRLAQRGIRESITWTNIACARFDATTTVEEAKKFSFQPLLYAAKCIGGWLKRAQRSAADLPFGTQQMFGPVRSQLSHDMSSVFESIAQRTTFLIDAKLRAIQKKSDFTPSGAVFAEKETDACKAVLPVLDGVADLSRDLLEKANSASLLNEIGEMVYPLLFAHICRFRYNSFGAVQFKLDLSVYVSWVRKNVTDKACIKRFEGLVQHANVLVVGADALKPLVRDLRATGAAAVAQEIDTLVKLRL